ncbi:hypothetical protein ACOSQ2_004307 [Xanthoceras sorbifolium]
MLDRFGGSQWGFHLTSFLMSLLGVKTNYTASVSPLVCAIISVVFAFKTKEETADSYPDIDHNGEDIEALLLDINSQVVEAFDHIEVNIEALLLDTDPVITSNNLIDYVHSSADEIQLVPSILQLPWKSAQSDQLQPSSHVNDQIQRSIKYIAPSVDIGTI